VPWKAIDETLPSLGKVTGKVVVDITVPYGKEIEALGTRSSGEVVQKSFEALG
jgi:predicted dinucleotide-binding enzyme